MALGPLEYALIQLKGSHLPDQMMPKLQKIQEEGIIRIVNLFLVEKDDKGNIEVMEWSGLSDVKEDRQYAHLASDILELLAPEGIELVAHYLPTNSSTFFLLFEHTWAIGLREIVRNAGGVTVERGRVTPSMLQEVEEEMNAARQANR